MALANLSLSAFNGGANSQTCVTSDQVNPNKAGYKHWVARSGTLIANLLVTAGRNWEDTPWMTGDGRIHAQHWHILGSVS
jgi:hypothetical protein